ncbi:hypothetical protein CHS0354_018523 [Potamilus streckersoni]|uniref:imidazole glycerol-phosphate synthase n=1 Tax=Potamilus streckersoni TaxID=2493646 RepID=A0AAE0TAK2_9BIVA|nr:hypothetical protein CHS0354_018523 [Potamilus streckersoni]
MLAVRVIPCLDIHNGRVVKGVNFVNLADAGDPLEQAKFYNTQYADELVFLDITATSDGRDTVLALAERVAREIHIPFTIGGGIRDAGRAAEIVAAGADKISLNSAAVKRPELISECAERLGSQCVVLAVDVRKTDGQYYVYTAGGRHNTGIEALTWIKEACSRGAGEILLTSMDADGTRAGFDLEITRRVSETVKVPVIASGGGGVPAHFADAAINDPLFVGNDNDNTLNTHNYIRLNDGNYILRRNGNTILHLQFSKMTSDINRDNIYELYDIRFTASRQEYQTEMQENQPPGKPGRKSAQPYTKASAENESQPTGKAGYGIYDVSKKELTLKEKPEIILKGQPPVEITGNQMTVYTDSQLLKDANKKLTLRGGVKISLQNEYILQGAEADIIGTGTANYRAEVIGGAMLCNGSNAVMSDKFTVDNNQNFTATGNPIVQTEFGYIFADRIEGNVNTKNMKITAEKTEPVMIFFSTEQPLPESAGLKKTSDESTDILCNRIKAHLENLTVKTMQKQLKEQNTEYSVIRGRKATFDGERTLQTKDKAEILRYPEDSRLSGNSINIVLSENNTSQVESITAMDDVSYRDKRYNLTAQKAVFTAGQNKFSVTGNVTVYAGKSVLSADALDLTLADSDFLIETPDRKRMKIKLDASPAP